MLSLLVTTGMRLDEICLLEWSQIHKQDGNLFVNLLDANVKNQGSSRLVALHRLTYPLVQNQGSGRLFDYSIDRDGKAENAASRVLMPLIRQITNDDRMVVHSLRGNFKDLMRDADVSKENHLMATVSGMPPVSTVWVQAISSECILRTWLNIHGLLKVRTLIVT